MRFRIVGIDADDIQVGEIAKSYAIERFKFTAENEVEQLLGLLRGL
jgi:hypothetical protein